MSDPNELFAIVPGSRPESIVEGPMSEVMEYIGGSVARAEKEERLAQQEQDAAETEQRQAEVRACAAQMLVNGLTHLSNRLDQFETRRQERAEQAQRDAEAAEYQAIEEMLALHPNPDDPHATGDDGELAAIKPAPDTDTEKYHPEETEDASFSGVLPKELTEEPVTSGPYAVSPAEPEFRNPVAIGGN
jgi:hypothetical protein